MRVFEIGDAVNIEEPMGMDIVYMIVDVTNFGDILKDTTAGIEYELMQVYPVEENASYRVADSSEVLLHSRRDTLEYNMLFRLINRERANKGYTGVPDYLRIVHESLSSQAKDIIDYTDFNTIDDCLDAVNDLKALHKMFGDKEYLNHIDTVIKRMREIQELELMRKDG